MVLAGGAEINGRTSWKTATQAQARVKSLKWLYLDSDRTAVEDSLANAFNSIWDRLHAAKPARGGERQCTSVYGVGAGDSVGDGEGLAGLCAEPAVVLWCLLRVGVGDGWAAAVVVVVPCCWQEGINATATMPPSKYNMYFFIASFWDRTP